MQPVVRVSTVMSMVLAVLAAAALPARAQSEKQSDKQRLAEIAKNAARQFETRVDEQTRPAVPITTPGPTIELTLDDATARAVERNLDVAVERLNPQIQEANLERLHGLYRPVATSTVGHRAVVQPPTNQLNGGIIVQNDTSTYNGGIAQSLGWDPTLVRLLYIHVSVISAAFPGILVYLVLWVVMPKASD